MSMAKKDTLVIDNFYDEDQQKKVTINKDYNPSPINSKEEK